MIRRTKPIARKPTLAEVDLTKSIAELMELTGRSESTVVRARRAAGLTKPTGRRPRTAPTPKPPPKPPAPPVARPERSSPRQSANVTPPAAANDIDPVIRQALADEMKGWGTSPGIAAMLIATRYRVAREVVERIAEDVAGMRRAATP
jgi:hypothetical protein